MQGLLYATLLLIATFLWGYAYYRKDYHPQPLKVVISTFAIGLFAMLPLFGYKYLYETALPTISEFAIFEPLLNSAILSGLVFFVLNLAILSIVLFSLSGALSLVLTWFSIPVIENTKKALKTEPLGFMAVSLLIGGLIIIEKGLEAFINVPIVHTILGTLLFLTIIEEYIKHLIVRFIDDKRLKDVDDAITLSIMVGLAFAFVESVIYALASTSISIVFYRAIISIPIHMVASGIFGYYYGLAHFSKPIVKNTGGDTGSKWLQKIFGIKGSFAYKEEKITQGLFWATLFHAVNNLLLELELAYITIPIIVFGLMSLGNMYALGKQGLWMIKAPKLKKLKKA